MKKHYCLSADVIREKFLGSAKEHTRPLGDEWKRKATATKFTALSKAAQHKWSHKNYAIKSNTRQGACTGFDSNRKIEQLWMETQ